MPLAFVVKQAPADSLESLQTDGITTLQAFFERADAIGASSIFNVNVKRELRFTRYTSGERIFSRCKYLLNFPKALNTNVDTAVDKLVFLYSLFILMPWSMAPVKPEGVYGS